MDAFAGFQRDDRIQRAEITKQTTGQDVAPNDIIFSTNKPVMLTPAECQDIVTGRAVLIYIGLISYSDAFSEQFRTEFCYQYTGSDPTTWHICDVHHVIR